MYTHTYTCINKGGVGGVHVGGFASVCVDGLWGGWGLHCFCMCIHVFTPGCTQPCKWQGCVYIHGLFILAEFCPEPGKHIGQPPDFSQIEDSDEEDGEIPDAEWNWDVGVGQATEMVLRRAL